MAEGPARSVVDQGWLRGRHAVVTGGAGFLGSHVSRALLDAGADVTSLDNLITGSEDNLAPLLRRSGFRFLEHDVTDHIAVEGDVDVVLHFASPASPVDYLELPIQTLKVGALGTHKALGLARAKGARFMLASTSEVYGDPQVHPQPETYWGHVNPIGPRGVYDEAKRFAEALTYAYHRSHGVDVRVPRIFNSYGPGMRLDDGRAVPTFISQALAGEALTVHGDGQQTRTLQYVDDLIDGLMRLLCADYVDPVNLGSTVEVTIESLARTVVELTGSASTVARVERPADDPQVRRPDTAVARRELGWAATTPLRDGLARTIATYRPAG